MYEYKNYLQRGKDKDLEYEYVNVGEDYVEEFKATAELHGKLKNNIAMEFIEAWLPEETAKYGKDYLYEVNRMNCEEMFPGSEYVRVPHVGKNGGFHVHIMVGAIHPITTERFHARFEYGTRWKNICDARAKSLGLGIEKTTSRKQKQKLPQKARMMQRRNKSSRAIQVMQRADVARRIATNMKEYERLLLDLGIAFNDRGKALSYFHPGQQKAIRGRQLGTLYEKEELLEQFKRNEVEFANRPEYKTYLKDIGKSHFGAQRGYVRDANGFPFLAGGHQYFENGSLQSQRGKTQHSINLGEPIKPADISIFDVVSSTIRDCRGKSIAEYCEQNKIPLIANKNGSYRLKGREYIEINGGEWINNRYKKNGKVLTQGSLIEFVANHKDLTILGALAEITGNKRLLLLEQHLGKIERPRKEFHVPRVKEAKQSVKESTLQRLARHIGRGSQFKMELSEFRNVQVSTKGIVQFILGKKKEGLIEYKEGQDGSWKRTKSGKSFLPFLSQSGSGKKATIYKDPFVFIEKTKGRGLMSHSGDESILVLGDGEGLGLDLFLIKERKVKSIELIGFNKENFSFKLLDRYKKLGIEINFKKSGGRALEKDRSIDLPDL